MLTSYRTVIRRLPIQTSRTLRVVTTLTAPILLITSVLTITFPFQTFKHILPNAVLSSPKENINIGLRLKVPNFLQLISGKFYRNGIRSKLMEFSIRPRQPTTRPTIPILIWTAKHIPSLWQGSCTLSRPPTSHPPVPLLIEVPMAGSLELTHGSSSTPIDS